MAHTCPIQGLTISKACPVTSCMWNCRQAPDGCAYGSTLLESDVYLAQLKGLKTVDELEQEVDSAKQRIACLIALDKWCTQLKDRHFNVPEKHIGFVNGLLGAKPQFSRSQGWSISSLYGALSYKEWKKFRSTLSLEALHREVLGLSRKDYKKIQQVLATN